MRPLVGGERGVDAEAHRRAAQHRDVAAVLDLPRLEARVGREHVLEFQPIDERQFGRLDPEDGGPHAGRLDEIVERLAQAEENRLERAIVAAGDHRGALEGRAVAGPREDVHLGGGESGQVRRHGDVRAARHGGVPRLHVDAVRARGLDARHGDQHRERALAQIGRPDREDRGRRNRDAAHHGDRAPEAAPLEAAAQVGFLAFLDRGFDEPFEHGRRLAGLLRVARGRSCVDRAEQQLVQRRFVLLEVERHLLVADPPGQRPHEEEPAEAGQHEIRHDARGDDGGRAEAELLEAVRGDEDGADAGAQQHGQAAQDDLPAPPRPDAADRAEQGLAMSLEGRCHGHHPCAMRGNRPATRASMASRTTPAASRYHHTD